MRCPKCETVLTSVKVEYVSVEASFSEKWKGAAYTCPRCGVLISVSIDPVALKAELLEDIRSLLGRR